MIEMKELINDVVTLTEMYLCTSDKVPYIGKVHITSATHCRTKISEACYTYDMPEDFKITITIGEGNCPKISLFYRFRSIKSELVIREVLDTLKQYLDNETQCGLGVTVANLKKALLPINDARTDNSKPTGVHTSGWISVYDGPSIRAIGEE